MNDPISDYDPGQALAAMRDARMGLAARMNADSSVLSLLYGALIGFGAGGQALPWPFNILGSTLCAIGLCALAYSWTLRKGVRMSGLTPRRSRWVMVGLGVIFVVSAFAVFLAARRGMAWVGWPVGLAIGLIAMVAARLWRRMFLLDAREVEQRDGLSDRLFLIPLCFAAVLLIAAGGLYLSGTDEGEVGWVIGLSLPLIAAAGLSFWRRRRWATCC